MKELTEEQMREMRARREKRAGREVRDGTTEMPPVLSEEDENLLDAAWRKTHSVDIRKG